LRVKDENGNWFLKLSRLKKYRVPFIWQGFKLWLLVFDFLFEGWPGFVYLPLPESGGNRNTFFILDQDIALRCGNLLCVT